MIFATDSVETWFQSHTLVAITYLFVYKEGKGLSVAVHYLLLLDKEALFFNNLSSNVSVDITVFHNGYHGDLNETFFVGEVDDGAKRLVQTTYESLMQAIDAGKKSKFLLV